MLPAFDSVVSMLFIGLLVLVCCCSDSLAQDITTEEATAIDKLTQADNVVRVTKDMAGKFRARVVIDAKHSAELKFAKLPTAEQLEAARQKVIDQEFAAAAEKEAADQAAAQSEAWKEEGKCPCCGQALPEEK